MIFQSTENCARALFSLNIPKADVSEAEAIWNGSDELRRRFAALPSDWEKKYSVTDKLFPAA